MAKTDAPALGEPADESAWRALVDAGLKNTAGRASWDKLVRRTADDVAIAPLYREPDFHTAEDPSGFPGAAPFIRGAAARDPARPWLIRQSFDHPDPERANADILADLAGGVSAIELVVADEGRGVRIGGERDVDHALAGVIVEAAPVSLDAGGALRPAELMLARSKGANPPGTAYNVDPIGALMRTGAISTYAIDAAARFAARARAEAPAATSLRIDARPVHEAGGTEAQEIAAALSAGVTYLRAAGQHGLRPNDIAWSLLFTMSVGPDVLIECAKLRALRLCWARVMEASGAAREMRAARIHAVTSRRMMTRYDAWTNITRVTTAAFAAAIGGADAITTLPMTDALGLPTPFARRVARNTQHVLMEEAHLGRVADPAGGAWFVEKLTRDLAAAAWAKFQAIEAQGGIVAALASGALQADIAEAREKRQRAIATRREAITGVTDYPLLDARGPEYEAVPPASAAANAKALTPIRWAEPFEALRDRAEPRADRRGGGSRREPKVFFANVGALLDFAPRAAFAQNLFAAGGVRPHEPETRYETMEALAAAYKQTGLPVAVITGMDECYAEHAANCARALKQAGASWVVLAGKPQDEDALRAAGVDQFVFAGQDAVAALTTLHFALGLT